MENTFKDKVVVVTGGAQGIGRCIAEEFTKAGAHVCVIDKQDGNHYVGDISDKGTLEAFAADVIGIGTLNNTDKVRLNAYLLEKAKITW